MGLSRVVSGAAGVVRCFDTPSIGSAQGGGNSGPGFFAPRWYWEAFVAYDGRFDHVMVDGKPGRWVRKDEAKAAAESAYEMWQSEAVTDCRFREMGDQASLP